MNEDPSNELLQSGAPSEQDTDSASPVDAAPETEPTRTEAPWLSDSEPLDQPVSSPPSTPESPEDGLFPPLHISVSALSDVGCVRTNNEDSFGYDEESGIYVVCDGMGGMASGEVASSLAATAIVKIFAASASSGLQVGARLLDAINSANSEVWESGQAPENRGMGTTAVAAALDGNRFVIGNVGDSRAYLVQGGQCIQITVDHSYLNELIRNGTLTQENAHKADLQGFQSVITRAVGVAAKVQPDFYSVDLQHGADVLLTTDGLTRHLQPQEIVTILEESPFESACANLIDLAKQRGGHDNITCILLRVLSV